MHPHIAAERKQEDKMNFEQWMHELAIGLRNAFAIDGREYIRQTGEECWREMFDDGLSPAEAVSEEVYAASTMLG